MVWLCDATRRPSKLFVVPATIYLGGTLTSFYRVHKARCTFERWSCTRRPTERHWLMYHVCSSANDSRVSFSMANLRCVNFVMGLGYTLHCTFRTYRSDFSNKWCMRRLTHWRISHPSHCSLSMHKVKYSLPPNRPHDCLCAVMAMTSTTLLEMQTWLTATVKIATTASMAMNSAETEVDSLITYCRIYLTTTSSHSITCTSNHTVSEAIVTEFVKRRHEWCKGLVNVLEYWIKVMVVVVLITSILMGVIWPRLKITSTPTWPARVCFLLEWHFVALVCRAVTSTWCTLLKT